MKTLDILRRRLINQQIAATSFNDPVGIVGWLGAMQSQEYAMAKWAIGLRLRRFTEVEIEAAFTRGDILRTHCMRPTWHFVTPRDIRWIQLLTSPRVQAFSASYYRKMNLDSSVFKRSHDILARALEGGKHLTRAALGKILTQKGIKAEGLRLAYLIMCAELDCVVCSGPREGKQFTYALLDERAPATQARTFNRDQALAELAKIYFASRSPATIQDFSWWSGLTIKQVKEGIALLGNLVTSSITRGRQYFFLSDQTSPAAGLSLSAPQHHATFLMPDYDEYGISYKDRSDLFADHGAVAKAREPEKPYSHMIVIDGRIAGTWQPSLKGSRLVVDTRPFQKLSMRKQQALSKAVKRYLDFFNQA